MKLTKNSPRKLALLVVAFTSTMAILLVVRSPRFRMEEDLKAKVLEFTVPETGQQGTSCSHLQTQHGVLESLAPNYSLEDWFNLATTIAKVQVVAIGQPMFGTTSGGIPVPMPTGYDDPESDTSYDPQYDQSIHQLVVLDTIEVLSGTMSPGVIVVDTASQHPSCPDYIYDLQPDRLPVAVNDTGLVFLRDVPPHVLQAPIPGYASHALNLRDQLNSLDPNNAYQFQSLEQFYKYAGSMAGTWWGAEIPISFLESEVEALLEP